MTPRRRCWHAAPRGWAGRTSLPERCQTTRGGGEVSSGLGSVVIELTENLSARFDLETADTDNFGRKTRITSDWNLTKEETDRWVDSEGTPRKYVRARSTVGEGRGLITVRIVNGNVTIRRGSW